MNSREFFDKVCELRKWQKEFARTRCTEAARKVKKIDQEVDAEVARVRAIIGAAKTKPNIFDK